MNHKNTIVLVAAGVISIGLLVYGLITTEATRPLSSAGSQENRHDLEYVAAASISKETLLLLLAVGIAGVLGMSRRKKNIKNEKPAVRSNRPSDP